jgi:hypothetical protein
MLRAARGVGPPSPHDFATQNKGFTATSPPLPSRPHPDSDQMSIASSPTAARPPLSFTLKRKASDTTLPSSSTGAPSLRLHDSEDPFIDGPRGSRADMMIESEPIRGQLADSPFIFIPLSNNPFRYGNLHHMKTMIENAHFSPKCIRADQTGYFIIFESSTQGDNHAALCFERFQGKEFRGISMKMELNRRRR